MISHDLTPSAAVAQKTDDFVPSFQHLLDKARLIERCRPPLIQRRDFLRIPVDAHNGIPNFRFLIVLEKLGKKRPVLTSAGCGGFRVAYRTYAHLAKVPLGKFL